MQDNRNLIIELEAEHRDLKARVRELQRQTDRTSAEQVEYDQLKAMQLHAGQRLRELTPS